jgi:hypothetical protein
MGWLHGYRIAAVGFLGGAWKPRRVTCRRDRYKRQEHSRVKNGDCARMKSVRAGREAGGLFLPGALLVTVSAQFLAAFMFIDLGLPAFFQ